MNGHTNGKAHSGVQENELPWSEPTLHETNNAPATSKHTADRLRKNMRQCFSPPPETYGHKALNVSDEEWKARVDLAAAYRLCCHYELNEGIVNHLTAWVPDEEIMLVHPFGIGWDEVTASNLVGLDKEGNIVRGNGNPEATAYFIHMRLHLNRKAAEPTLAVLHTHMPYTTALCCLEDPSLPMIHQTALRFWKEIAYDPCLDLYVDTCEAGDRMAAMMGEKRVLLQSNHGVTIACENMWLAFDYLYYLERACKQLYIARCQGLPLREALPVADTFKNMINSVPHYAKHHFEAEKRMLLRHPMHKDFMK